MPELNGYLGYMMGWAATSLTAGGFAFYFWRCGWFESSAPLNRKS